MRPSLAIQRYADNSQKKKKKKKKRTEIFKPLKLED
jgi:hypothetical protein